MKIKTKEQFILKYDLLEVGDIILESGKKLHSIAIQKYTKSKYSHAMICVENTSIIHAEKSGIFSLNPQRLIVKSQDDLKVYRLRSGLADQEKKGIQFFLRTKIGSLYSVKDALLVAKKKKNEHSDNAYQFCSRLVAQAYYSVKYSLVDNIDYCSPADLENSDFLYEVKDMVRKASSEDIRFASTRNGIEENQASMYDWLNKTRDIAWKTYKFEINAINDVDTFLTTYTEEDKNVCDYIKASGYLENYEAEIENNLHLHNSQLFIEKFDNVDTIKYALNVELNNIILPTERHVANMYASKQNYSNTGLSYYKLHIDLYGTLLAISMAKLITIFEVSKDMILTNPTDQQLFLIMLYSQENIETLSKLGIQKFQTN